MTRRRAANLPGGIEFPPWAVPILSSVGLPYRVWVSARNILYDRGLLPIRRLPIPVVCVGNLSVGGTGKTPFLISLARRLRSLDVRTVLLSRGYRGKHGRLPEVVFDGRRFCTNAVHAGDEPILLARKTGVPVVVGANRYRAGLLAYRRFKPDLLLMDDGFQHRRLARDLDIVLLDARSRISEQRTLPAGRLREPVSALQRAGILVLSRWTEEDACRGHWAYLLDVFHGPVFKTVHVPSGLRDRDRALGLECLKGKRIVGFSGLAGNYFFRETLEQLDACVVWFEEFRDHMRYGPKDITRLRLLKERYGAEVLITTEKDIENLEPFVGAAFNPWVLEIDVRFIEGEDVFWQCWGNVLERSPEENHRQP